MGMTGVGRMAKPGARDRPRTAAVIANSALWRELRVVAETGSTNSDLLALARTGEPEGLILLAEAQTAGRGRLDRQWVSPPGTGLTFSVLLRPGPVPASQLSWLPLLMGVAAARAVGAATGLPARLKWPNDLLAPGPGPARKLGGILAETCPGAVVAGLGINLAQPPGQLPAPGATSVRAETGTVPDADAVLAELLAQIGHWYRSWRDQASPGDPDACGLRAGYQRLCATLGREVTVSLPGGQVLAGRAAAIDGTGRLGVDAAGGLVWLSAGDVIHLR